MTTHIKAMTYTPKVPLVLSGECRQTIRGYGKRSIYEGDTLLLHGWSGRPYWSPWSWRLRAQVCEVGRFVLQSYEDLCTIASLDGVGLDRPLEERGLVLRDLLYSMGARDGDVLEIIRWSWPPIEAGDV